MSFDDEIENEISIYKIFMNFNALLAIFSTALSIYLIFYKSMPEMNGYRWHLLNNSIWCCAIDVYLGILYTPRFEIAARVFCSYGLLRTGNFAFKQLQNIFIVLLMNGLFASIFSAFCYRYAAVTNSIAKLHNKKSISIMVLAHVFYLAPLYFILLYFLNSDYSAVLEDIKEKTPVIYEYTLRHSCICFSSKVFPIASRLYELSHLILISTFIVACIYLAKLIIRKIETEKANMSEQAFAMHRELTYSLIFQFSIPLITLMFSATFLIILQVFPINDTWKRNSGSVLFVLTATHSLSCCLSLVLVIQSFRKAVMDKLRCRCSSGSSSVVEPIELANNQ